MIAEINFLVKTYGVDEIYFEDDNFTTKRSYALDVLSRLSSFNPPLFVKFANGIRADLVDRELLVAMKKAGVYALSFGIESGSRNTLARMKKNLNLDKARANILLAKSLGFLVGANCILGYPGETLNDIKQSLDFFLSLPLDSMAIVNCVPFPGTELRTVCEQNGFLTPAASDWNNYYFSVNNPIPLIATPQLSGQQLISCVQKAYRRMYLRPWWILRTIHQLSPRSILTGVRLLLGPIFK